MNRTGIFSLGFALAMSVQTVQAEEAGKPSYTADAVVSHMIAEVDLGATRAICIGTKSECDTGQPKPKGFDMLLTFDLDSAELLPEAKANLEVVADALNDDRLKAARFLVEGHTDASGTDSYNMKLSEARARAVTEFLVARNVETNRIVALGLGEGAPRSEDPYDPENRRVELKLSVE